MLSKFEKHVASCFPFLKGKKLLLAVSGGIDSMVLMRLCVEMKMDISVAHCNFTLRGDESDADEDFVKSQTDKLQIPIFIQKFDTEVLSKQKKQSIQVTARNLRYDWFYTLLNSYHFDYILTAHQLDDSLETFLINFTRGTGLDGLSGIPQQNGNTIRPLLAFSREEIERYAKENNVAWREDSSNASNKYVRNKMRHDVIPLLKEINSSLLTSFENTIASLQQAKSMVDDASKIVYNQVVSENETLKIDISKLKLFQNYHAYLYHWISKFGFTDWNAINEIIDAQSGKNVFSESHILLKDRNFLIVYQKPEIDYSVRYWINKSDNGCKLPLQLSLSNVESLSSSATNVIFVDENKLMFPLEIRRWENGDWFYPSGMNGKKKVSKFFKDEKYSLLDKSEAWLLCSNNQIVWIIGDRQDDRFKVTETTTKILKIKYSE